MINALRELRRGGWTWERGVLRRGMRVRVSVEGAFKCGTKEGKGRLRTKKKRSTCNVRRGKHGGMFKELKQGTSKFRHDCHRSGLDAGVRQRSEVMPRFAGRGADWVEKQGFAAEKSWVWLSSEGYLLWTPKHERQVIFVLCIYNQCLCLLLLELH